MPWRDSHFLGWSRTQQLQTTQLMSVVLPVDNAENLMVCTNQVSPVTEEWKMNPRERLGAPLNQLLLLKLATKFRRFPLLAIQTFASLYHQTRSQEVFLKKTFNPVNCINHVVVDCIR